MIYLLHGSDTFSSAARLRALRAALDPDGFSGVSLDGQETALDALRAACDALAFFGAGRCVDVRGLLTRWTRGAKKSGRAAADEGAVEALAAYLPALPPTTTLILWEPGPVELPAALRRALQGSGAAIERFEPPLGRELRDWVAARAAELGAPIQPDAAVALLDAACPHGWREAPRGRDAAPPNLYRLDSELRKLATASCGRPAGPAITARDVASLVVGEGESNVFDLVNAVADGNTGRALDRLRALLDDGVAPEAVLPLLASQFGALARLRLVGGARADRATLAGQLGVSPTRVQHLTRQFARLGEARVARCLAVVLEADEALKTGRAPRGDDALYWAVLELCGAGPPGPSLLQTTGGA
ncbi:MAG TPA: hypothetical protein VFW96_03665 [Thermomicrobiales bacterium]|nr:hypothetical protein [Thermomicrobiales bacterium]